MRSMPTVKPPIARQPARRQRATSERVARIDAELQRERVRASLLLVPARSRSSR
jgi:hypothetical protein